MEIEQKTIKEILEDSMNVKGFSVERLSELTDIPERFVKAIIDENITSLPSSPYVRGYFVKIAEALNLNGNELWAIYKENLDLRTSGGKDKLPHNRFELKPFKKRNVILIVLAIIVVTYLAFKIETLLGVPNIDISNPATDNMVVNLPTIDLRGEIDAKDKLTINNEEIATDKNGYFEKKFLLEAGINSIEFKVKRLLGKETTIVRKVIYQQ